MCNIHVYPEDMFRKIRRVILNLVEADRYIKLRFIIRDKNCLFTTLLKGIYMLIICFRYYIVHTLRGCLTLFENTCFVFSLNKGRETNSKVSKSNYFFSSDNRVKTEKQTKRFEFSILQSCLDLLSIIIIWC